MIFSEIIPKTSGATYWRKLAVSAGYVSRILMIITFPFVWLSQMLSAKLTPDEDDLKKVSREEIAAMAEMGEDEGSIDEHESDIIENLFRLKDMHVESILTPRSVIYAFEDTQSVGQVMDADEDINFSRIPVYKDNIDNIIPDKFSLDQNYPNPFNPITRIRYSLERSGDVKLDLINIQGRTIATYIDQNQQSGDYEFVLDGSSLSNGVYFYRLTQNGISRTRKMVLLK